MWALLSTRLRTWLFFAIAVPVVRSLVHRAAARSGTGTLGNLLRRADSTLTRFSGRGRSGPPRT